MPILPLPQFEDDLAAAEADRKAYAKLTAPKTMVVRFGEMKLVGEFPYRGDAKPGCGSKIVVQTHRGTEIGEMLTSTCPNAGCSKSVTRKQMLEYIDNSGGKDYPFFDRGKALRVATAEDMHRQTELDASRTELRKTAKRLARESRIDTAPGFKLVEVEPILGGERLTVYYTSDDRLDTREFAQRMSEACQTRVDTRQVGARDEARINADYEKCGQYCCCKNFLKVLKPVSMKSAKIQKATLDPLKISGRCGRLMCCLRYEDQTYDELRKRLPHRKSRTGTPHGDGMVLDSQILTQLVRIRLDDGEIVAVPVEDLSEPVLAKAPPPEEIKKPAMARPRSGSSTRSGRPSTKRDEPAKQPKSAQSAKHAGPDAPESAIETDTGDAPAKKKRRRRRKKKTGQSESGAAPEQNRQREPRPESSDPTDESRPKKKRRRRRRRKPGAEGRGEGGGGEGGGSGPSSPPPSSDA